jgi:hypothetical protein
MNWFEQLIYDRVKNNPRLKRRIAESYKRAGALIPAPRQRTAYPIAARQGFFFGFHDRCPWSADDTLLAAHRSSIPLRMPGPEDTVEVGYFSGEDYRDFRPVARTRAWNWQTGAQLQWAGAERHLIFNDYDGTRHVARLVDHQGRELMVLPRPVAAVSSDGATGIAHEFARFRVANTGYAYANGVDPDEHTPIPADPRRGISAVRIQTGEVQNLFSVADIAAIDSHPAMKDAYHYFTQPLFAPSGHRFAFIHEWVMNDNRKGTRIISCGADGRDPHVFPAPGMVSHYAWRDDRHVLMTVVNLGEQCQYLLFEDGAGNCETVAEGILISDGHPQYSPDRRWILTDTYPDRLRVQNLILFDTVERKRYNIAKLREPIEFDHDLRCDLHPRWNRAGTRICFDSAHTGQRSLCTLGIGSLSDGAAAGI